MSSKNDKRQKGNRQTKNSSQGREDPNDSTSGINQQESTENEEGTTEDTSNSTSNNNNSSTASNTTENTNILSEDPFLTLLKNIFANTADSSAVVNTTYDHYKKDFEVFLDIPPEETMEFVTYFLPNIYARKKMKRIRYYFAYKKIEDITKYIFDKEHIATDKYVRLYENDKNDKTTTKMKTQKEKETDSLNVKMSDFIEEIKNSQKHIAATLNNSATTNIKLSDVLANILLDKDKSPSKTSKQDSSTKTTYCDYELKVNSKNVAPSNIDSKSFMNDVRIKLNKKEDFMLWYKQFQNQCLSYNIHLRSHDSIRDENKTIGTGKKLSRLIYNDRYKTEEYIGQLLYNKLNQEGIINKNFTEAKNIMTYVPNGFEFLDVFIRQCHLTFKTIPVITETIPIYSKSGNINSYCKNVIDYFIRHDLSGQTFTAMQISKLFLYHLDSETYSTARDIAIRESDLHKSNIYYKKDKPPAKYSIFNLPGTILTMTEKYGRSSVPRNPYQRNNSTIRTTSAKQASSSTTSLTFDYGNNEEEETNNKIIDPFINYTTVRRNNNSRPYTGNFKGRCKACGVWNHHAKDCTFLRKLQSCLAFLKTNPNLVNETRESYKRRNTYQDRNAKIRKHVNSTFIPYDNVDCDLFLDHANEDLHEDYEDLDP